jgi:hypothetical protein
VGSLAEDPEAVAGRMAGVGRPLRACHARTGGKPCPRPAQAPWEPWGSSQGPGPRTQWPSLSEVAP